MIHGRPSAFGPALGTAATLAVPLALAACMPPRPDPSLWYRAGADPARMERALTACEVDAAREVPANTQIRTTPEFTTPQRTRCRTSITGEEICRTTGGDTIGGDIVSYDSNAGLRTRVVAACMQDQGYARITLPRCSDEAAARFTHYTAMPQVAPGACAVPVSGGGYRIVTP
ncbi:hypothetical protein [Wenxinia marina]|uniref:Uncharacterized protein n=1 Tax=Wenxinia marina DSM 24838 TaxID=1123501 RepID=A0A0D0QDT7_9RHOB|nr:hypothetical protein [Wenxinia marina]KIQ70527.1 hypothetical protein Wenmar_00903 [Wenxinia marina DSM 24838]GGL52465.1 hypothetical protein GCM10011392_03490 [Wenxinia marina]